MLLYKVKLQHAASCAHLPRRVLRSFHLTCRTNKKQKALGIILESVWCVSFHLKKMIACSIFLGLGVVLLCFPNGFVGFFLDSEFLEQQQKLDSPFSSPPISQLTPLLTGAPVEVVPSQPPWCFVHLHRR